ncbi:hypothetical protein [Pseudoalteromonas rhizosphaerae]|uniref:hypothetical protein n=1 Tax=Pseudoalteromonas rhizosphaerae TaxID=2518973 RepID=UPI002148F801|nr:hypothetical protein [Pseudoalteromonas rhizosphaerae]
MKIHHKNKVASKRITQIKKTGVNKDVRSACLSGEIFSDPYVVAASTMAIQYVISYSIGKIKTHLRRHESPLITKCNFILTHPEGEICGADAEILQIEIEGKTTIIHRCSEFSTHVAHVANRRKISRLQKLGKYRK